MRRNEQAAVINNDCCPVICINGEFYIACGSSVSLALVNLEGGNLLQLVLGLFGNEPSV